jgi:hypothetical protein
VTYAQRRAAYSAAITEAKMVRDRAVHRAREVYNEARLEAARVRAVVTPAAETSAELSAKGEDDHGEVDNDPDSWANLAKEFKLEERRAELMAVRPTTMELRARQEAEAVAPTARDLLAEWGE